MRRDRRSRTAPVARPTPRAARRDQLDRSPGARAAITWDLGTTTANASPPSVTDRPTPRSSCGRPPVH